MCSGQHLHARHVGMRYIHSGRGRTKSRKVNMKQTDHAGASRGAQGANRPTGWQDTDVPRRGSLSRERLPMPCATQG